MSDEQLHAMRHSLAHITAAAVQRLWPEAKFGVGPVVDNGFYYDIDLGETKISEQQFGKIEKMMRRIIAEKQDFVRTVMPIDEAITWAEAHNQPYKVELLNDQNVQVRRWLRILTWLLWAQLLMARARSMRCLFYTNGNFMDLCRGPHVENTSDVGAFKLLRVAGGLLAR